MLVNPPRHTGAVRRDPTRPLLTWYDDATGERTELSGATLANWVAKTANLLVDGIGLGPGDRAGVSLPPHWQTAGVLLGCWSAGVEVVVFNPVNPAKARGKWEINNRNHRKLMVVDGRVAFTGGINISSTDANSSLFRRRGKV